LRKTRVPVRPALHFASVTVPRRRAPFFRLRGPDGAEQSVEGGDLHRPRIELRRFAGPAVFEAFRDRPLRVVHLTDLHVGRMTPMRVQFAAADLANAQKPDLVVITGDFVCHSRWFLDELEEVLRRLRAPTVGVLGNHDWWSGAPEVRRVLSRSGVEVLDNACTEVELGGRRLALAGVDDAYTGHADTARAVRGLRRGVPSLGLTHIPEEAEAMWAGGVSLVLAGHTHAGQVTWARLHEISVGRLAGHRYIHGLYGTRTGRGATGALYVGAGIGSSVMPLRLGERGRREIAVFDLGVAPGDIDEHHEEQEPLPGRPPSPAKIAARHARVHRRMQRLRVKAGRGQG